MNQTIRKPAVIFGLIAIVLAGLVAIVRLSSDQPNPSSSAAATASATPAPTASVVSSHLSFERNPDGGFSAEFVIHPDGQLEARQVGIGYPEWEYLVAPRVAVRMTDDDGHLLFAPALTCPDPARQAEMPERDAFSKIKPGTYNATLTIDEAGEPVSATLKLIGVSLNSEEQGNATLSWTQAACAEHVAADDTAVGHLIDMLPAQATIGGQPFDWDIRTDRDVARVLDAAGPGDPDYAITDYYDWFPSDYVAGARFVSAAVLDLPLPASIRLFATDTPAGETSAAAAEVVEAMKAWLTRLGCTQTEGNAAWECAGDVDPYFYVVGSVGDTAFMAGAVGLEQNAIDLARSVAEASK